MAAPAGARTKRRTVRNALVITTVAAVCVWAALSAALYWAMSQPPDVFGRIIAKTPFPVLMALPFETLWKHARAGRLSAGDAAPDFELPLLDRSATVRLSSNLGVRPVVLVFGSYT